MRQFEIMQFSEDIVISKDDEAFLTVKLKVNWFGKSKRDFYMQDKLILTFTLNIFFLTKQIQLTFQILNDIFFCVNTKVSLF